MAKIPIDYKFILGTVYLTIVFKNNVVIGASATKENIYTSTTSPDALGIHWVSLNSSSDAVYLRTDPVGIENQSRIFLCRGEVDIRYKPGSLVAQNGRLFCRFSDNGQQFQNNSFQMLKVPPGTASWVLTRGRLPDNAIVGGIFPNGTTAFICRGWSGAALLVGSYYANDNTCFVAQDESEEILREELEVLVINLYGLAD